VAHYIDIPSGQFALVVGTLCPHVSAAVRNCEHLLVRLGTNRLGTQRGAEL
jgi:hypothetical protein